MPLQRLAVTVDQQEIHFADRNEMIGSIGLREAPDLIDQSGLVVGAHKVCGAVARRLSECLLASPDADDGVAVPPEIAHDGQTDRRLGAEQYDVLRGLLVGPWT